VIITQRWPYATVAIVALNLFVFLATHGALQQEAADYSQIQSRTVLLAAMHPDTPGMTAAQQKLIGSFRQDEPQEWERLPAQDRSPADAWESQARTWDLNQVQQKMTGLGQQLSEFEGSSLTARWALYPPNLSPLSYITAGFLHRSWAQLIFNLLFLWLVGAIMEDVWGWAIFLPFYIIASAAAVWSYAIVYPNTAIPLMGASGALAAVMGAFLIRFPKTRMRRGTALWSVRPRLLRFSSPVYVVFPVWIVAEMFGGSLVSERGSLGYFAQGGAFAFGIGVALVLRFTGIDSRLEEVIDAKEGWTADPHIIKAGEYLEKGNLDFAIAEVKAQIAEKPASAEAHAMLVSLCLRKKDTLGYMRALEARCGLQIKVSNQAAAWQDYRDYTAAGGRKMPADTWLELCRVAEDQETWERALSEYEELARVWPQERASVVALIAAGRLYLQHGRPEEAKRVYTEAQKSPVPHTDWDETIRKGLERTSGPVKTKV
jgi:membrane associated rhomboid family serine protease